MKRFASFIFLCSFIVISGYAQKWVDTYDKVGAPGYEELSQASYYASIGDNEKAIAYYNESAKKKNLFSIYNLAIFMINGEKGMKKNVQEGLSYMLYAADHGYAKAQRALFFYYSQGEIVGKNIGQAKKYLEDAVAQGFLRAKEDYAESLLLGSNGYNFDEEKGLKIFEECAKEGSIWAQYSLGRWYYDMASKENQSPSKALMWLTLAADNGDDETGRDESFYYLVRCNAANDLALRLIYGNGIEKDFEKAHRYIERAKIYAEKLSDSKYEALVADSKGEIYLAEGKEDDALLQWNYIKEKFPEYVEKNKFVAENVFVKTMYARELAANKNVMASNENANKNTSIIMSDVDENIPENSVTGTPTFAVIIANENYVDVESVPFAIHDGQTFKHYCEKTLGIPQSNIRFVKDATLNNIKRQLNWLKQVMDVYQGETSVIFYYAGHGIPNESNGAAYILPVDGYGNDVSTAYSLDNLYDDLSSRSSKSVLVLLDACFSGAKRDGGMIASARGVAIKAKQNAPKGHMVVLAAAQGDETAYPFKEKGHGMFTYYLLKKIQETGGNITLGELANYVTTEVKKQSLITNGKIQTPLASPSDNAVDWKNWKLR